MYGSLTELQAEMYLMMRADDCTQDEQVTNLLTSLIAIAR